MSYIKSLHCPRCQKEYTIQKPHNLCSCGSPLLVDYDLTRAKEEVNWEDIQRRPFTMWRYREFLPVQNLNNIITFGEGGTPLYPLKNLGIDLNLPRLHVKDEGLNPTGSFKARGAATGVSRALELGIREIAMPTAGNAGSAWAAYCTHAGLQAHVAMPADTPSLIRKECLMLGANIYEVDGIISDAGRFIAEKAQTNGWFETATLKEPYRIEGKKTMGYELAEQLNWQIPDAVIYPTGGGVGLIGIWKAFCELEALGKLQSEKKPKMISVQADGCAPIVQAFNKGAKKAEFWPDAHTIAPGIRVPSALGDFLILTAIYNSGGVALAVTDNQIQKAVEDVAKREGLLVCPEAGAAFAALAILQAKGILSPQDLVVIINTGNGLKNLH